MCACVCLYVCLCVPHRPVVLAGRSPQHVSLCLCVPDLPEVLAGRSLYVCVCVCVSVSVCVCVCVCLTFL